MVTDGLDLHKRHITACALDASGAVLAEHRRLEHALSQRVARWRLDKELPYRRPAA
jgi:hypothetical protein